MHTGTEPAHRLLELLITKTLISGKTSSSSVTLNYNELCAAMGQYPNKDAELRIKIDLSWEQLNE